MLRPSQPQYGQWGKLNHKPAPEWMELFVKEVKSKSITLNATDFSSIILQGLTEWAVKSLEKPIQVQYMP